MKILHVVRTLERAGGTEGYVLDLAAAQRARGDDVVVASVDALPRGLAPEVVHVHTPDTAGPAGRVLVRTLHDYAFACATNELWLRGGPACGRAHGPGCLVGMAVQGCAHRRDPRPGLRSLRRVRGTLGSLRDETALVFSSEYVRAVAARNGLAGERCRVVPYFVRRPDAPPAPASGRTVAFVGRLVHAKGLDVLLEALARGPDAWNELLVVGEGRDRPACESLAAHLGLGDRVRFLGWLDPAGVAEVLRASAVLAVPSRWPEPFGIVGIEAMAAARPVVAGAVGGIPEWLDGGETGLLVPPGDPGALADALGSLLDDPARRAAMGSEAWRRAGRFSAERHLAALDAVYAEAAR